MTVVVAVAALALAGPALAAPNPSIAALQVALRAQGHYTAPVDGLDGPLTQSALRTLQLKRGIAGEQGVGPRTREALGRFGAPLLGQRQLMTGAVGWDVSSLEFRLRAFGLPAKDVDGTFTARTAAVLKKFQAARGLPADGIAGPRTFRALVVLPTAKAPAPFTPPVRPVHVVKAGESFFSIAELHRTSPLRLAKENGLSLNDTILPGQRLVLPNGATAGATGSATDAATGATPQMSGGNVSRDAVRASLDHWAAVYGVDPKLARAVAWMESGFQQDVVSDVGAIGVMQLLPGTWQWLDQLIGVKTPRTYDGNVRAGVRYLRWLLDTFDGDRKLALAGYYQGAAAVKQRGLYDDTKQYVALVLRLVGTV